MLLLLLIVDTMTRFREEKIVGMFEAIAKMRKSSALYIRERKLFK